VARFLPLPGASGNAFLDYIAYEHGARRVWVPVGSTGSVDVLDTTAGSFTRVDGFQTTIARLDDRGHLGIVATAAIAPGARNPVADEAGNTYVADSQASRILAFDVHALGL
jgi:hypothetical protein